MKRTKHSKEFLLQVIKEAQKTGYNTLVARRYELNPNMVGRWIHEYRDGKYGDVDAAVLPDLDSKENERLKTLSGEKDLEIAILRDLIKKKNTHLLKTLK